MQGSPSGRGVVLVGTEIRDPIIDWVERHGEVPTEPSGIWRIAPQGEVNRL